MSSGDEDAAVTVCCGGSPDATTVIAPATRTAPAIAAMIHLGTMLGKHAMTRELLQRSIEISRQLGEPEYRTRIDLAASWSRLGERDEANKRFAELADKLPAAMHQHARLRAAEHHLRALDVTLADKTIDRAAAAGDLRVEFAPSRP